MEETSIGLDELLGLADELEGNEQGAEECEARGSEDTGSGFDAEEVELLSSIGQALSEAMSVKLRALDLNDKLSDEEHQELMFTIFDKTVIRNVCKLVDGGFDVCLRKIVKFTFKFNLVYFC